MPAVLNPTWTRAVRFAFVEAPIADITASIVEPMLLPSTSEADSSQLSEPFAAIVSTIAVVADDEWINAVMKAPINTPTKSPKVFSDERFFRISAEEGFNESEAFRRSSPIKRRAKPIKQSAKL